MKSYKEMLQFSSFEDRFEYLKLKGRVGEDTFGYDRWLNQRFYKDPEWRSLRDEVIVRDYGCDLAITDREIFGSIIVHHINPITKDDILKRSDLLLDPNNLICVTDNTHKAIHYGDKDLLVLPPVERHKNDTSPWRL